MEWLFNPLSIGDGLALAVALASIIGFATALLL